jgi:CheY-like chemotaxis protein
MDQIQFVHAPSLAAAVKQLQEADWDVVLMDYSLGAAYKVDGTEAVYRDGKDLIKLRRSLEEAGGLKTSFIIGTSSNQVGNRLMVEVGADTATLKINVPEIAKEIEGRMALSE